MKNIVELVPRDKRQEAERLMDQFHQAAKAIAVMTPGIDTRYSSCPHVIDAIKLFLTDIDRPATRSEIMLEVVRRGSGSTIMWLPNQLVPGPDLISGLNSVARESVLAGR